MFKPLSTLLLLLLATGLGHGEQPATPSAGRRCVGSEKQSAFTSQIRPMLERRCSPCHFTGGKMYGRLPFDRPETIRKLGTKLFTRIKDESERAKIRQFLAERPEAGPPAGSSRR